MTGATVPEPYPPIEPYDTGMLDVGDGHLVYWETCGNPDGKPAVFLHGGPGGGSSPGARRTFDPKRYRIVLFDQRGAGRSTPYAGEPVTDLSANTTHHLVADLERLREHLSIERWLVFGASWGCTLGLAYAERHPDRITEMILAAVSLTRREDVHWLYHGVGRFFPAEWERFRDGVPPHDRDGDLVAAYARLLTDPDPAVHGQAAQHWRDWEDAVVSLEGGTPYAKYGEDPRLRLAFARLCAHYFSHAAWLDDDELLRNAGRLAHVPGVLIHGRLDLGNPFRQAWELAQAWPGSELVAVDDAGHTSTSMGVEMRRATDRLAF